MWDTNISARQKETFKPINEYSRRLIFPLGENFFELRSARFFADLYLYRSSEKRTHSIFYSYDNNKQNFSLTGVKILSSVIIITF